MLLKTIVTPNPTPLHVDLSPLSAEQATEAVCKMREDFLAGKGIRPVVSKERVVALYRDYEIFRINIETNQIGELAGDMNLPHNCVAVIFQNTPEDMRVDPIYITSDVEAYIISDAGVTVTVVNGKKAVDGKNLKGAGHYRHPSDASHVTIHGSNVKIDTPHLNIHSGVSDSKTGPAK